MGKISKTSVSLLAKYKTTAQFFSIALYYYSFAYNLALGFFIAGFILFLSACCLKSGPVSIKIFLFDILIKAEDLSLLFFVSCDSQTAHLHPITGTP